MAIVQIMGPDVILMIIVWCTGKFDDVDLVVNLNDRRGLTVTSETDNVCGGSSARCDTTEPFSHVLVSNACDSESHHPSLPSKCTMY